MLRFGAVVRDVGLFSKEAAMMKYRDAEEAWERKQEKKDSATRIAAAKRKVEEEAKVGVSIALSASEQRYTPTKKATPFCALCVVHCD